MLPGWICCRSGPQDWRSDTTMAVPICRTIFNPRSPSGVWRVRQPLSGNRKATAVPNASSAPSRRTSCGPAPSDTIDELREALLEFRDRYNQEWIIERHSYRTPNQVRRDWEAMKQSAA